MKFTKQDKEAINNIISQSSGVGITVSGAKVIRTSSRFCLGVEHGDYNGTELFGFGVDRFIWIAYKPNNTGRIRLFSCNFSGDGIIEFGLSKVPNPKSKIIGNTWGRFAYGVEYILRREGFELTEGMDAVVYGNIPGGGMSRSASLTLNLILSTLDVNGIKIESKFKIVELAQAVENDYIGSPCGELDQIMILFAQEGTGVHYNPKTKSISYIPFSACGDDFRIVVLDTGTVRSGLEKSTYKIRRAECEKLVGLMREAGYKINCLADIRSQKLYDKVMSQFKMQYPNLCERLNYIYHAQQRFYKMLKAWKKGDIWTVGRLFNEDGIGLRDHYEISGPQLETMCDIAREVPGVLGARMLGGGDKGAAAALVRVGSIETLKHTIEKKYPQKYPEYTDKFSIHICNLAKGVQTFDELLV